MRLTVATYITLLRMLLIPFIAIGILYHRYGLALLIFLISGLSDMFDGLIARHFQQKTRLGALLDPMADKLLLSTCFLLLTLPSTQLSVAIPVWLAVMVFGRDILIVVSSVAVALNTGFTKFDPTFYGKSSTALQIVCVLTVLVANYFGLKQDWFNWLYYATFGLTLLSGIHYFYIFNRRYNEELEASESNRTDKP